MKAMLSLISALVLSAFVSIQANAHPHHNHGQVSYQPPQPLAPEIVATFDYDGETLTVWNTHARGLFGLELIEFRNAAGRSVGGWWTSRGWCFTATAYETNACHSNRGYLQIFKSRIKTNTTMITVSKSEESSGEFCDHYSKLEYKISEDSSGVCGY